MQKIPGISKGSYVVVGAELKCPMGSSSSKLLIPISHRVKIKGKDQANILDFKPMLNILPFGTCKMSYPPTPCIPMITAPWLNGKEDVLIEMAPALLNTSMCICGRGGVIQISNGGQS